MFTIEPDEGSRVSTAVGRLPRVWLAISFVSLTLGFVLTFDPSFVDAGSTAITLIPFLLLPTMAVSFTRLPAEGPSTALTIATVASIAAWTVLVLDDDRWVALTFALYGLAFSLSAVVGLPLAGAISCIWIIAWAMDDAPTWRLVGPVAAFVVGVVVWGTFVRAHDENSELARLVDELRATQADLAASEREKGVLEERTRVAGEIHDTLAQGFTSIVVLARSAMRSGDAASGLADIESVASESLQSARRLVAAMGPAELDSVSLPEAMERHIDACFDDSVDAHFDIVGTPRALGGVGEVTLLRALQEALLNVRNHACASNVHVTLGYLADRAVLDVVDDGIGFQTGEITDRGVLTGGQGLRAIRHRVGALGGSLEVETAVGTGTAISVQIPSVRS